MSLPKFPSEAQPVLDIIRAEAPRPVELPEPLSNNGTGLAFKDGTTCPMGLVPGSRGGAPTTDKGFADGRCTTGEVIAFYSWWDAIKEPEAQAVVDFIWGKAAVTP